MLTLCRLAAPVSIKPPQSPHLKPFRFFTTRARFPDGSERLHLHMGYFATLSDAQKWAQVLRRAYPNAIATLAPTALVPTLRAAYGPREPSATGAQRRLPAHDLSMTDTQVLAILDTRRVTPVQDSAAERNSAQISMLRPEDTGTRRILRTAVVQGAKVSFAVQLQRSVQPIDLARVPALSVFQTLTLYTTEGQRDGRSWHCLRLGFFTEAIAAKEVAYFVRPSFSSVAVVPVTEEECMRADDVRLQLALASPAKQRTDKALAADRAHPLPASSAPGSSTQSKGTTSRHLAGQRSRTETLEETLEVLAASEDWTEGDALNDTGVRHLKIEVQKRPTKRS